MDESEDIRSLFDCIYQVYDIEEIKYEHAFIKTLGFKFHDTFNVYILKRAISAILRDGFFYSHFRLVLLIFCLSLQSWVI